MTNSYIYKRQTFTFIALIKVPLPNFNLAKLDKRTRFFTRSVQFIVQSRESSSFVAITKITAASDLLY